MGRNTTRPEMYIAYRQQLEIGYMLVYVGDLLEHGDE